MSTATKLKLVAAVRDEYDLKAALAAIDLPKSTWYYHRPISNRLITRSCNGS